MDDTVRGLLDELAAQADPERAVREKAYLESDLRFLGVGATGVKAVARGVQVDDLPALVDALWGDVHELRAIALVLLEKRAKKLGPDAVPQLEGLLRTSKTWAYVDALAVHVVGSIAERHDLGATLDRWAVDGDFWIRRSAMLTLFRPMRRGGGDLDRFFRYADAMLEEREFFIRKAIGWGLREIAGRRPEVVAEWVRPRVTRMSGVTFREAVRKLPDPLRAELEALR